jgi:NADPH-dependent 2,4-dienoyl-CoA reductase/sulfur reductase-like enzyme
VERLIARTPEVFRARYNMDVRVLHEVVEVDVARRRVRVCPVEAGGERAGADNCTWEAFDHLLFATGALPIVPDVPGAGARGIYALSTLQSGVVIRAAVDEEHPRRAVIVGGGYVGLEMAEALVQRGLDVSLVEKMPQVMNTLDPDMGSLVSDALRAFGVHLYLEEALSAFEVDNGRVRAVVTTDGASCDRRSSRRTLPADLVVLGIGVRPNTALAADVVYPPDAGLPLGARGAIRVDQQMRTPVEGVWAAGDCAESLHLVSGRPTHVALGTVANKHGRVAGINIAAQPSGPRATFPGVVGTAITKVGAVEIARTGLQEAEMEQLGIEFVSAKITSTTRAGYYPGAGEMTVKVHAEKGSGRLLGGQIVGAEGAAKRIDVLATALHAGFTVQEVMDLDLAYAPPYSSTWDPVAIAARQALKLV